MSQSHYANVSRQFGPQADEYVRSAVHAAGEDLDRLAVTARAAAPRHAIDLGSGGGHVAYRLAECAERVMAVDLSVEMLGAVAEAARLRGLSNIETKVAPAEHLPFADGVFDFLGCRFSAHHWRGFDAGLREARRVLARGSLAVFIDVVSPAAAALDTHLQTVELLRDTSHVRDYTAAAWFGALDHAGFAVRASQAFRLRMDFATWTARMRTPEMNAKMIRALQDCASDQVINHFEIEPDGSFMLDTVLIEAVAV